MGSNGQPSHPEWIQSTLHAYQERLLRYAQRILHDEGLAQDAVQETFLKLCHEDSGELNGWLAQWLYTVCRNQAFDMLRKESRMTVLMDSPPDSAPATSWMDSTTQQDEQTRVLTAIEQLSERQQECLRLKFEHGLSYRAIAEVTGMSISNVGFTIHTALKKLRTALTK